MQGIGRGLWGSKGQNPFLLEGGKRECAPGILSLALKDGEKSD